LNGQADALKFLTLWIKADNTPAAPEGRPQVSLNIDRQSIGFYSFIGEINEYPPIPNLARF
jgi:hypothetical protein